MFKFALKSLIYRKWSLVLTISTLLLSLFLLILVSRVHQSSRGAFTKVISNTDLIVGPRTSAQNLLMYSALGIGQPTHSVGEKSYNFIQSLSAVNSVIPITIGDSYKGHPVIATTEMFFNRPNIDLNSGDSLTLSHMSAVLGSEVASKNHLKINDSLTIDHGGGAHSFESHDEHPFNITAVLKPTGTPLDRFVFIHVSDFSILHGNQGYEGVDSDKVKSDHSADHDHDHDHDHNVDLKYNAFFVNLKNKSTLFNVKKQIDEFTQEPLVSIIPGQTLLKFWENFKVFELAIEFMAMALILMSLLAVLSQILSNIQIRVKELTLYKISGASNRFVILLVFLEVLFISILSIILSYVLFYSLQPFILTYFLEPLGLYLNISQVTSTEVLYILIVTGLTLLTAVLTSLFIIYYSKKMSVRINRGL